MMKHFMLPKGTAVFREAQAPPAYDSPPPPKSKSSSKKQARCKENTPPPDPNSMGSDKKASPVAALLQYAQAEAEHKAVAENALAGASDMGVKELLCLRLRDGEAAGTWPARLHYCRHR